MATNRCAMPCSSSIATTSASGTWNMAVLLLGGDTIDGSPPPRPYSTIPSATAHATSAAAAAIAATSKAAKGYSL